MPGGIRLAERAPADIDVPAAGKITIFPDSAAADVLAWMDSAGDVHHAVDEDAALTGYQPLDADLTALAALTSSPLLSGLPFVIDGGGSVIATGVCPGDIYIPVACKVIEWHVFLSAAGSIVVDIWKDTEGNYPPTVADTITGAEKPTVSGATKASDTSLNGGAGWALAAGTTLRFNVDSVAAATYATVNLVLQRT